MREGILYNTNINYDNLTEYTKELKAKRIELGEDYVDWIESQEEDIVITRDNSIIDKIKLLATDKTEVENGFLYEIENSDELTVTVGNTVTRDCEKYLLLEWIA